MRRVLIIGWTMAALAFAGCGGSDGDDGGDGAGGRKGGTKDESDFIVPNNPCNENPAGAECQTCLEEMGKCEGACPDEIAAAESACDQASFDMQACMAEYRKALTCLEAACPKGFACSPAAYAAAMFEKGLW